MPIDKTRLFRAFLLTSLLTVSTFGALAAERPLKLDLQNAPPVFDEQLKNHVIAVRKRIQNMWLPPGRYGSSIKIRFVIEHSGQLENIHLTRSSGDKFCDQRALDAIYESTPFPPWAGQSLDIEANFNATYLTAQQMEENQRRLNDLHARREHAKAMQRQQNHQLAEASDINSQPYPNSRSTYHQSETRLADAPQEDDAGDLPDNQAQTPTEEKWKRPLSYIQYKHITSDQQQDYMRWLDHFMTLPIEQQFPFLKKTATASHKPARN